MPPTTLFESDRENTEEYPRQRRRRSDPENSFLGVRWTVVAQVVGYILGAFVIYNALTVRIAVVEERQGRMRDDIAEMKGDVKILLSRKP